MICRNRTAFILIIELDLQCKNGGNMETNKESKSLFMPTIAMRGMVLFPKMVIHFDIARDISTKAVEEAIKGDRKIFLVAQRDIFEENPSRNDVYEFGVVAEIRQTLKTPDNILRVLVEGIYKAKIVDFDNSGKYLKTQVEQIPDSKNIDTDEIEILAVTRSIKDVFERYSALIPRMPKELMNSVMVQDDPKQLFENIAYNINLHYTDLQSLLEEDNILIKLSMIYGFLVKEIEVLEIENQIQEQVKENVNRGQREYYLREQMRVISSHLGEDDSGQDELYEYFEKIEELNLSDENAKKLMKEAERLNKMPPTSQESYVIRNYLDICLDLPWNKSSKTKIDINKAQKTLDKDHYGLKKVKERVLESIAVHALMPDVTGQIICLVGPPGVGKTSIGRSIAKSLGRKYARVSLGGVKDESDIRGHRKTYVGAMPGRIINAMISAGTNNPLILLDEIDKMGNDYKGDPASAMLEVLDSEQNKEFRDHYIEIPFDLSKTVFVTTANTTQTIPSPLLDRMEVIEITSYTREEKFHIAKGYLVPKQIKKNGLKGTQVKFDESAIYALIDSYTREAGVRNLERKIASLCRKAAKEIVSETAKRVVFSDKNIEKFLGGKKYLPDFMSRKDAVGVVNGLAWTSVGGVIMPLEVVTLSGKGTVEVTGSLGDVMKESAKIAVSYVRSISDKYNINENFYKEKDLHIHAPEGAVPKDGPSAGVTIVTSMVSALSGIPVRSDVAMTGEITLHGRVLPIGGLREKTMAAYKEGIKTVIIPEANKGDLSEVEDVVKDNLEFIFVSKLEEVLENALTKDKDNILPDETASSTTVNT